MFILDDLLLILPAKGLMKLVGKINELVETEVTDESRIKEELLELQTRYAIDDISDDEYATKEAEILERLTMAREMVQ
jgi:uncharacterized membrane protein